MKQMIIVCLAVTLAGCCAVDNGRLAKRLDALEKWKAVVDPEIYEIRRTSYEQLISMIYERDRIVSTNAWNIDRLLDRVDRIERGSP